MSGRDAPPVEPSRHVLPETALSRCVDPWLRRLGAASSWLWLVLLLVVVLNVLLRYAFGEGRIEFEELQWHLYAVGFLVALATGVEADVHVRVDVLAERFTPRTRAWVDLYGLLLLFLPFVALVLVYGVPFVLFSWRGAEVSAAPGGLPYRWAIKGALVAGFALLTLAGLSRLSRVAAFLFASDADVAGDTGRGAASGGDR